MNLEQRYSVGTQWGGKDLAPDWSAQVNRCVAPCRHCETLEWLRSSPVATLGELFMHLGTDHTATAIYAFLSHAPPACAQEEEGPPQAEAVARLCQWLLRV